MIIYTQTLIMMKMFPVTHFCAINEPRRSSSSTTNFERVEDITQYFYNCQKYTNERARLINFLINIGYTNQITLKELLGGGEGDPETLQILINSQVALFIKKTKRFEI